MEPDEKKDENKGKGTSKVRGETISTKKDTPVQKPAVKTASIMFKENRKFDLHIGREMVTFRGREIKQIPREWLLHRDFLQASDYFVVKGV